MNYLQTLVTTLQAVMHVSQPHAFHCVTETVQQWPDPPFPALVMQYIQSWGGSGLVHETSPHVMTRTII